MVKQSILLLAVALIMSAGCAMHSVDITTNVYSVEDAQQSVGLAGLKGGAERDGALVSSFGDVKAQFSPLNEDGERGMDQGMGIFVQAGGRTLAVAGPVEMSITCKVFGKDSNIIVNWGGLTYMCEGGELSEQAASVMRDIVKTVGAVVNPASGVSGLLGGDNDESNQDEIREAVEEFITDTGNDNDVEPPGNSLDGST